ncbi:putative copper homeostasis protein [Bacteroides pyogenes JCM 10003]|nr:putative copper homeostasis protein [Bacteroides pyogenes JCM 10003]
MNEGNIARIAKETGIQEFHFSARESARSPMTYKNESVSMGGTVHIHEYERTSTTVKRVRETIHALCSIAGNKK